MAPPNTSSTTPQSLLYSMANQTFSVAIASSSSYYPQPPQPLLVDRIQLALLIVLFVIGAPINLVSFTKLRSRRSLARTGRLALLRLHLNISDLMVLLIFVTSSICWQLTYQWRGGDLLCKLVKFLNSTSFQLSSNIMVCVALDRVFTVICGTMFYKRYVNRHPARYVRICVISSWILAVVMNVSQLFVWVVVAPYPHVDPNWHQCVTIWGAAAHFNRMSAMYSSSNNDQGKNIFYAHAMKPPFQINQFTYGVFHIAVVFWIPAAIIVISYTIVVFHMFNLSAKRRRTPGEIKLVKMNSMNIQSNNVMTTSLISNRPTKAAYNLMINQNGGGSDEATTQVSNLAVENGNKPPRLNHQLSTTSSCHPPKANAEESSSLTSSTTDETDETSLQTTTVMPTFTITTTTTATNPTNNSINTASSTNTASKAYLLPVAIHRMRNKTFRMSLLLVLAYFFCWTPYNVLSLWQFFDADGYRRSATGLKFLNALIVFNSVVNPFLYGTLKFKIPWRKLCGTKSPKDA